jgi:hypothetical protein
MNLHSQDWQQLSRAVIQGSTAAGSFTGTSKMSSIACDTHRDKFQLQQLPKGTVVAASSGAASVWAGLTEVERTSLLVAFAR